MCLAPYAMLTSINGRMINLSMLTNIDDRMINLSSVVEDAICRQPFAKKGWKVYDLDTNKQFVSQDVASHEAVFPYCTQGENENMSWQNLQDPSNYESDWELLDIIKNHDDYGLSLPNTEETPVAQNAESTDEQGQDENTGSAENKGNNGPGTKATPAAGQCASK